MDRQDQEEVQVSLAATDFFIFGAQVPKASLWADRRWLRAVRDQLCLAAAAGEPLRWREAAVSTELG